MKELNELAVFVYGTLKPGGKYWAEYCEGKMVEKSPAQMRGRLFALGVGYPALVLENEKGGKNYWVQGWRLVMKDAAALRGLDELEGYDAAKAAAENEYYRVRRECFAANGGKIDAPKSLGEVWVYVMMLERMQEMGGAELPEGEWK